MNELLSLLNLSLRSSADTVDPPALHLHAVSTRPGSESLPNLLDAIDRASGWVLHRQMVSASLLQLRIEAQGRALMDLYGALLEQGLELTRDSHRALAERCSCLRLTGNFGGSIITLHLDVQLPEDLSLFGQWMGASSA